MPKFSKSTGYKMKGFTYPGESPLKIASVSGAQLVESVGKTYDKYVNYGKIAGDEIKKGLEKHEKPMSRMEGDEEQPPPKENGKNNKKEEEVKPVHEGGQNTNLGDGGGLD